MRAALIVLTILFCAALIHAPTWRSRLTFAAAALLCANLATQYPALLHWGVGS